ncbi:MAG: hypothetical protein JJD98_13405 [Polaromonas sp.]|nr:hypothetical protein [Polaromonas sp.]
MSPQGNGFPLAHLSLEGRDRAHGIRCRLTPGGFTHQNLAIRREGHIAGKRLAADTESFGAGDDDGTTAAQNGSRRIGGAKIDADDSHRYSFLFWFSPKIDGRRAF